MKGSTSMDQRAVMIKELAQGLELVKRLRTRLSVSSTGDDQALNHSLVDKMLSVFNNSISLAKFNLTELHKVRTDSPRSLAHSCPGSEDSSHDLRPSRKRKKMPPRIEWVRVSPGGSGSVLEGPLDDGYSWRKYGQKQILKAKHPRGYYRCTHRHTQGCFAKKQVQKSDQDPSIYRVIYRGEHTCPQQAHLVQANEKPNEAQIKVQPQPQPQPHSQSQPLPNPQQCQPVGSNQQEVTLGLALDVGSKVDPTGMEDDAYIFGSLSLNSAQCEPGLVQDCILSSSPGFWPLAASEYNCFPISPCRINAFGLGLNAQTSQSDLNELICGPSSVSNSPNVGDFEYPFHMMPDIDVNFSFDFDNLLRHM